MEKNEKILQDERFAVLAQNIGKLTDEVINKEHSWHGNHYQKWLAQHPMALDILRVVLNDEELTAEVKKQLGEFDGNVAYRVEKKVKMPTEEEHQELIDKLQNGLEIFCKFTKIMDEEMSDPERMSKGMIVNSLKGILGKLRTSFMTSMEFDVQGCLNQDWRDLIGKPVAVRPCGKEYEGKTYFGIYLGDFPLSFSWQIKSDDPKKMLVKPCFGNPAIFVPAIRKTIFGCESWWHEIENEEALKQITDEDINGTWYVQLMKNL